MSDFDNIELKISSDASQAESGLKRVDDALIKIQNTLQGFDKPLANLTGMGQTISASMNAIADSMDRINTGKLSDLSNSLSDVSKKVTDTARQVEQSTNGINQALNNVDEGKLKEKFAQGEDAVNNLKSSVKGTSDAINNELGKINITSIREVANSLRDALTLNMTNSGQSATKALNDIITKVAELKDAVNGIQLKLPPVEVNTEHAKEQIQELGNATKTWGDVYADISNFVREIKNASSGLDEATTKMRLATGVKNKLDEAFKQSDLGKIKFDQKGMHDAMQNYKSATKYIEEFNKKIESPKTDLSQPKKEFEDLSESLKGVKEQLDDIKDTKININTDEVKNALEEQKKLLDQMNNTKVKSGSGSSSKHGSVEWMASVVAVQHELEKASALFSRWGDIAKNAFIKALTPLKLFKHEFEEIKTLVERIGSGMAMISKPITKVFRGIQKNIQTTLAKLQKAWAKVMRTFTFMMIRKAITAIIGNIAEATKSLAAFSKDIGTSFNNTMSYLTSDFRYIGASLVAAFEPLLNAIMPSLDSFADALVNVINKVNMFFAVITGAKSYTIAKKKIVDYTEATKDANKAVKQLTMGIDELNILNDKSADKEGAEDLYDWEEIPTPSFDMPDWMKAIKDLIDAFVDAFKKAWVNVKDFLLDKLKRLLNAIKGLISDIIRDLTRLFKTEKFEKFLERCLRIIGKIADFIAIILEKLREAWNYNDLGYKILERILDILDTIAKHIENMLDMAIEWANKLTFVPLFEAIEKALGQVNYALDQIGYVVEDLFDLFLKLAKYLIEDWSPRLIKVFGNVVEGIGNIAAQIHKAWQELDFGTAVADGIDGLMQEILPHLEAIGEYFKEWGKSLDFKPLMRAFTELLESLKPVADFIGGVFEDLVEHYILPIAKHITEQVVPNILKAISHFADAVDWEKLRKNVDKIIKAFEHLQSAIGDGVAKAMDKLGQKLAKFINSKEFSNFIDTITGFVKQIDGDLVAKILEAIGTAILKLAEAVARFGSSKPVKDFLDYLIKFVKTKSVDELANIILGIAKAFLAFKGLSFLTKTASHIAGLIVPIGKLIGMLGPHGALIVGLAAAGAAFVLFHDQIAAIDWGALFGKISTTLLNLVDSIDWEGVGEALAKVLVGLVEYAVKFAFNPAWQAAIGMELVKIAVEIIQGLGDGLIDTIKEAFHEMGWYALDGFFEGMKAGWDAFWGFIAEIFQWLIDGVKKILGIASPSTVFYEIGYFVIQGLWNGISETWTAFWEWISGIWTEFVEWAKGIWQGIVDGIVEAWNGFVEKMTAVWETVNAWFTETWDAFKAWALEIWDSIVQTIVDCWNTLVSGIQELWQSVHDWISEMWTALHTFATETFGQIRDFVVGAWQTIHDKTIEFWDKIHAKVREVWDWMKNKVSGVFNFIKDTIVEKWNNIHSKTVEIWTNIHTFAGELWDKMSDKAHSVFTDMRDFLHSVWDTIDGKWSSVWQAVKTTVSDAWDKISAKAHGVYESLKMYIDTIWDDVKNVWQSAWERIHATVTEKWEMFTTTAKQKFGQVKDAVSQKWDEIKIDAESKWESIKKSLKSKWENAKETARTVFDGLAEIVKKAWDKIGEAVGNVWSGVENFISGLIKKIQDFVGKVGDAINKLKTLNNEATEKSGKPFWQEGFANGGFPSSGSVFLAGESGAELVGNINGKTGVANTAEITEAIEQAVSSAMEKIVLQFEKATDRMGETISDAIEILPKKIQEVVVELKTIRTNQTAIAKDQSEMIKGLMNEVVDIIVSALQKAMQVVDALKYAYQTDDSAVNTAMTKMADSSNNSNQELIKYIVDIGNKEISILQYTGHIVENYASYMKNMLDGVKAYIADAMSTVRNSTEMSNTSDMSGVINELDIINDNMMIGFDTMVRIAEAFANKGLSEFIDHLDNAFTKFELDLRMIAVSIESLKNTMANGMGIPTYAVGGFPEDGWFRASHGEIMGQFDNGQSVVANNDQITAGIAQAVSQSLVPILNDIAQSSRETANKDLSLSVDSREIARASNTGQQKIGKSLISFT